VRTEDEASAEYSAIHDELTTIRMAVGHKPWEIHLCDPAYRNPHPAGTPEHERMAAVVRHYRERAARLRAVGKEVAALRTARIERNLAETRAKYDSKEKL
jgi:hypothetical protein